VKYGRKLGIQRPFMAELVDDVVSIMNDYYPYLMAKAAIVKTVVSAEETKFLETLASGEKRFEAIAEQSLPSKSAAKTRSCFMIPLVFQSN
jgi:alanyl-tRNA synthetase